MGIRDKACYACRKAYEDTLNKSEIFLLIKSVSETKSDQQRIFDADRLQRGAYAIPFQERSQSVSEVLEWLKEKDYVVEGEGESMKRTQKGNNVAHTFRDLAQTPAELPATVSSTEAMEIQNTLALRERLCTICREEEGEGELPENYEPV